MPEIGLSSLAVLLWADGCFTTANLFDPKCLRKRRKFKQIGRFRSA
jgi:hypothetical protein